MGGDPATGERSKLTKVCKALGPLGLSARINVHRQAAAMGDQYTMRQANQQVIGITKAPILPLATLVRQLATINRTTRAYDERMETKDLEEIDRYATDGEHKDKTKDQR